jgi:hypothetical protein
MTDLPESLHNLAKDPPRLAADLLHHYSFELAGYPVVQQVAIWLEYYPADWLPLAIIEALHQGRYKAISVEQILNLWERRDHPVYHFNHEFERLICGNLPHPVSVQTTPERTETVLSNPALSYRKMLLELPSIQAASKLERLSEIPSLKVAFNRTNAGAIAPASSELASSPEGATNGKHNAPAIADLPPQNGTPSATNGVMNRDREFQDFQAGVIFGLSSGLAVSCLRPQLRLVLSQLYHPDWMTYLEPPTVIAPFTPEPKARDRTAP